MLYLGYMLGILLDKRTALKGGFKGTLLAGRWGGLAAGAGPMVHPVPPRSMWWVCWTKSLVVRSIMLGEGLEGAVSPGRVRLIACSKVHAVGKETPGWSVCVVAVRAIGPGLERQEVWWVCWIQRPVVRSIRPNTQTDRRTNLELEMT